jgi:hypothetical protein
MNFSISANTSNNVTNERRNADLAATATAANTENGAAAVNGSS